MLGNLEKEHLAVLRKFKKANSRVIWAELNKRKSLAYTTVSTTLDRLFKKGYLRRETQSKKGGKNYVYTFKNMKKKFANSLIDEFVYIFGKDAVNTFFNEVKRR